MSQEIFDSIDPAISGTELAEILNDFKDAIVSGMSGTSRPTELQIGGAWVDTTNDPNSWSFRIWTGTDDVEIFEINLTTGVASVALAVDSFIIKKISADTAGAILELVKRRIATSGQVLDGDVVGEVRIVGRTNAAGNPVVAKFIFTATDDQTASAWGGTFSFYSTPDGTNTLIEHMRFINGLVETIVPHKLNSQVLVSQNVATAATIAQLDANKVVIEMTGSTATDIQGVNSTHESKLVYVHNRSTAAVTLKHLDAGAAPEDQIKLPDDEDFVISPESTATLYYCEADTKWKVLSSSDKLSTGITIETLYGATQTWNSPANTTLVRVVGYKRAKGAATERVGLLDEHGNAYAWGINANGQLGLGDVTPRSSPVLVLGGFSFKKVFGAIGAGTATFGIDTLGAAYAWGINTSGQLGVGNIVPRSSPVAILGGLRFANLYPRDASCFGLGSSGSLYAWGINTNGQLGIGNVTPVSSPILVLGGQRFTRVVPISGVNASSSVLAINTSGTAYAWGLNVNGNLGDGTVVPKSSPVLVLGGLTFKDIGGGAVSSRYFFVGLNTAGAAYAWGANTNSNLGVGDQTPRSSPVAVLGGLTFDRLVTHEKSETVMAFDTSGSLYAWGDNTNGQLGVGDTVNRSSPVAVLGGLSFKKVKLFRSSAFGITESGDLYAWGANANGQLGLGDTTPRSSPVAVLGGFKFTDVFFGDATNDQYSVFGVSSDGLMYSWGANANGTLALGDVTPRSSPVIILGVNMPSITEESNSLDLTVEGGTGYTVRIGPGICTLGENAIGFDLYKVTLEYSQ